MLTLLSYFLTLSSYIHLQSPTLGEAKTTPGDGFTIDLLHRYSSMSPTQHFHQLLLDSTSRNRHIRWVRDNKFDTTITPNQNQGDYLMKVSVGTPPVELTAVASTGNDLTWFQCQPCDTCYHQITTIFNPALSSTYKKLPCDSNQCSDLDHRHLNCDRRDNECRYWYSYGNGSTITRGIMGSDTFSFTSSDGNMVSFQIPSTFGCGYDQYGLFDPSSAGLVGLGGGPLSLVSQLGPTIGYKFSYCLTPSTSQYTSKLRFGSNVETESGTVTSASVPYLTEDPPSMYNLNLTGISIGKMSVQVGKNIIIDIGTTLTYLNPSIFSSIKDMVNEALGTNPMSDQLLCYDKRSKILTPPDIVFHFSGGDLILKADNVFFEYDGIICLSIVMSEKDDDPMVFGNMAQVNLEVVYDLLTKTVTFAQKDCAHEGS